MISTGHGNETLHLIVGDDDLLTASGIGDILQIRDHGLDTFHFGRTGMNKNQIVDDGNQDTDFFPVFDAYFILHGNETVDMFLRKQSHGIRLSTVGGTHGIPDFGLFIRFHFSMISSKKGVLSGL